MDNPEDISKEVKVKQFNNKEMFQLLRNDVLKEWAVATLNISLLKKKELALADIDTSIGPAMKDWQGKAERAKNFIDELDKLIEKEDKDHKLKIN